MAKTAGKVLKTASKSRKTPKKVYLREVQKRNGTLVQYDRERIEKAVRKAMIAAEQGSEKDAVQVSKAVERELIKILKTHKTFVPTVEGIQDSVEQELVAANFAKTAKAYILYREERSKLRSLGAPVPENVRKLTEDSKKYFRNPLAEFIYYRTYSKWIEAEGRRETWIETVDRYMDFMRENIGDALTKKEYNEVRSAILAHEAMPSMRLMWSAGDAARKTNVTGYNCSYIAPSKIEDFAEIMYLSM
ncbi:MAG: ATP cone domain-containing protein, partial [Candidatus Paceibacterota bacterium]